MCIPRCLLRHDTKHYYVNYTWHPCGIKHVKQVLRNLHNGQEYSEKNNQPHQYKNSEGRNCIIYCNIEEIDEWMVNSRTVNIELYHVYGEGGTPK